MALVAAVDNRRSELRVRGEKADRGRHAVGAAVASDADHVPNAHGWPVGLRHIELDLERPLRQQR
ncbi:hypothetical protein D3C72_2410040 [compost metagenome]